MENAYLTDGPATGPLFIMAHGAGAPAASEFLQQMAQGLAQQGIRVLRFNFAYMQALVRDGKRRPPPRMPVLLEEYRQVVTEVCAGYAGPVVIGGKSMGGRVASLLFSAAEFPQVRGCVCLGYPFHPAGKPERLRTAHLQPLSAPLLMVQGTRDALGSAAEVAGYTLAESIEWLWLTDGDHDLKPRRASGFTHAQHLEQACARVADFIRRSAG